MTVQIKDWIYDSAKGRDIQVPFATLDYDPSKYVVKAAAAKAFHKALVKVAVSIGRRENEVVLLSPAQSQKSGRGKYWCVVWEAGPFEWAISTSFQVTGPWGFTEPYYSFDLCFVE